MSFTCNISPTNGDLTIQIGKHEGSRPAWWREIAVEVDGLSKPPPAATVDGRAASLITRSNSVTILITDHGDGTTIVLPSQSH